MIGAEKILVGSKSYRALDDTAISYRILITGSVEDEIIGGPLESKPVIIVADQHLRTKAFDSGMFCVAGYVERVFPDLEHTSYSVDLTICAPRYNNVKTTITVPQNAALPVAAPLIRLRPHAIRLKGRVVEDTVDRKPIEGAKIFFEDEPSAVEKIVALRTRVTLEHTIGTPVRECQITPEGPTKKLVAGALAGSRVVMLDNRVDLAVGNIVRVGPDKQIEYCVIEALDAEPADPNLPGEVTLRNARSHSLPAGADVQKVTVNVSGVERLLVRESEAGDGFLILDSYLLVDTVQIADAIPERVEYLALGALSDEDGFYRFDGIGGSRAVGLNASATGFDSLPTPIIWKINYRQPINLVNLRLSHTQP